MGSAAHVLIVGGGTCGCVLAARLSEQADRTVLLLEAGPGYRQVPSALSDPTAMPVGPGSPWARTYPATLSVGHPGAAVRGRVLGGSSAVNGAYFVRGTPADFERWGGTWSYDAVLPYFRRSERDVDFRGDLHGADGPMPVGRYRADEFNSVTAEFAESCAALGFPEVADKNAPDSTGWGAVPLNVVAGRRISTAQAYLLPAVGRVNLEIRANSVARRVIVESGVAIGVEAECDGKVVTLFADRIILCAGAIESPALLMRSGIGDPDLPVGAGLVDHPEIALPYRIASDRSKAVAALQAVLNLEHVEIRPYTAALNSMVPGNRSSDTYLGVALMNSQSRGGVSLPTTDPHAAPSIDYDYLSEPADLRHLRDGVAVAQELLAEMASRGVVEYDPVDPTDDWIAANLGTSQHMMGTCGMGDDGVVDESCRVHGIENLSVVDTSVIPAGLSRGPAATAVMIAERASTL